VGTGLSVGLVAVASGRDVAVIYVAVIYAERCD
jgi:hypothetical protein